MNAGERLGRATQPVSSIPSFRAWLAGRPPEESLLASYVQSLGAEWWTSEWKDSEEQVGLGVRKTVGAMANGRGGELLIGVRNDMSISGTSVTMQQLEQELQQPSARPQSWYVVSLLRPARYVTEVPMTITTPPRRAFVIEIESQGLPVFVREDDGNLALYLREGSSSVRAGGFETIAWWRETSRARLLLGIFREFETMVRQIRIAVGYDIRVTAGIQPRLPFLVSALEDGRFYELLSDDDISALLGRRTTRQDGDSGGFISHFLDLEDKVWQVRERQSHDVAPYNVERMTIQELSNVHGMIEQDVSAFRRWLVNKRLLS